MIACPKCGRQFRQKSHLYRHDRDVHLKIRNYVCILCGRRFANNQHLSNHMAAIHKSYEPQAFGKIMK